MLVLRWILLDRGLVLSAVYARAVAGLFQNIWSLLLSILVEKQRSSTIDKHKKNVSHNVDV